MVGRNGRVMVTGAAGKIGSELTMALRQELGGNSIVAVGHKTEPSSTLRDSGPYEKIDVRDRAAVSWLVDKYDVDEIYHMAASPLVEGEGNPWLAWDVNVNGLLNVLESARLRGVSRVFAPSSIAVFGPDVKRELAPQDAPLSPRTTYGITKLVGEALARQYATAYGLDVRGLRYPGIISSETPPGGAATDYAVEFFYAADSSGHYDCYVRENTVLPMMYMPDCIRATLHLMRAPREMLTHPVCYNVAAMSFSAGELARMIKRELPGFTCSFVPDGRQAIADSWPMRIDDRVARNDWDWDPAFGLESMVHDMLQHI